MYAVIQTGGKQYRVSEGDVLFVERDVLGGADGENIEFSQVLMVGGDESKVGSPSVSGASVKATILGESRGEKVIVFKKKRRKQYKRKQGHRQDLVQLRIDRISL